MHTVFENTARSLGQFTRFINNIFSDNDANIIKFCRTEYGPDWQWAYSNYKKQGRFPNHLDAIKQVA